MGRPEDRAAFEVWVQEHFPNTPVMMATDAQLVLAAGTPKGWGIALISGTGSLAYGEAPDGRSARAGGWGYLLGDEGSGYAIGLAALRAVARAADGRGPQTALTSSVLAHWGLSQPQNLVQYVYEPRRDIGRAEIAALAPLVEAATEDAVAHAILRQAGQELALSLKAVAQQLGLVGSARAIPCALAGSVLVQGRRVTAALLEAALEAAAEMGLTLDPVTLVAEPALGALKLARNVTVQTSVVRRKFRAKA
jgi:N-acetylglucosamine kinase-like BadF-type ATPase